MIYRQDDLPRTEDWGFARWRSSSEPELEKYLPQGECKRCHASIRWGTTDRGKAIPVDLEPVKGKWVWRLKPDGTLSQWTGSGPGYVYHRCITPCSDCEHLDVRGFAL